MSCTVNNTNRPFGWSCNDRAIQHHSVSILSMQVTKLPDGARYVEITQDDRVVFGERLDLAACADLARLLTD